MSTTKLYRLKLHFNILKMAQIEPKPVDVYKIKNLVTLKTRKQCFDLAGWVENLLEHVSFHHFHQQQSTSQKIGGKIMFEAL